MHDVMRLGQADSSAIEKLLDRYDLQLEHVEDGCSITGSYWGEPEAGVSGNRVYARSDTPLHSLLHETAHVVCMSAARRATLHRDAGGDDVEEAAVCYLQILLADEVPGLGRDRAMRDMDAWGYSFRLGSTACWFDDDAGDALAFLEVHDLITTARTPSWLLRD